MSRLTHMTSDYVGRIAVAVWIGRLTEDAARAEARRCLRCDLEFTMPEL